MPLPLHIFEDKYKSMLRDCVGARKSFGLIFRDGKRISKVGCLANILKITKKYDDGRFDILVRGGKRFEIVRIVDSKPYLEAEINFLTEDTGFHSFEIEELASEALELFNDIMRSVHLKNEFILEEELSAVNISFILPSSGIFPPEIGQKYLEIKSTKERLGLEIQQLKQIKDKLKEVEDLERAIRWRGFILN
jgi:Lon protease-like protein